MDRDEGLQGERTALSWRRTGLALLVRSLVLGRLTLERSGPVVVVVIGIAAVVVLWPMVDAFRHGRMALVSPCCERFSYLRRDGGLPAAMTLTAVMLAAVELAVGSGVVVGRRIRAPTKGSLIRDPNCQGVEFQDRHPCESIHKRTKTRIIAGRYPFAGSRGR